MLNNDLLKIICERYPNKAKDLGESIGLLNMVLDELLSIINHDVSENLINRNHEIAGKSIELHQLVCSEYDINNEIIEFIESLIIDVDCQVKLTTYYK